ncbi:MAG: hypothetical protein M3467_10180 [Actinomycetota bacterium]|nr:hypothetical protein [Actinomycetota bacterium]
MSQIAQAVQDELAAMGVDAIAPGQAAVAMALARQLDDPEAAPTSAAIVARELRATLIALHKQAPGGQEGDGIDELNARREARRGTPVAARRV